MLPAMLTGAAIHHWVLTGLAAVTFILFIKAVVAPALPKGFQTLVAAI